MDTYEWISSWILKKWSILLTISNVRAMDGIMNCVDYKFTLCAKWNIFAVIGFSDADTLISIWHMNYLDIVHSSCLSSQSGAKFDNHLGETSQANDGVIGCQWVELELYITTLTILAFFQNILRSFRHTQHHFCISFETLFILGLNDPPNWHQVDFKSDYWMDWLLIFLWWKGEPWSESDSPNKPDQHWTTFAL